MELYKAGMARPKKFSDRAVIAFPEGTFVSIARILRDGEDRSDFLREAAELEIAIRGLDIYQDLMAHLITNETLIDFCAKAVRQAGLKRIAVLKDVNGDTRLDPYADEHAHSEDDKKG